MARQLTCPLAVFLSLSLLAPALPLSAWESWPPVITIETGQPSVWSLAQAHYLLAQIHQRNRTLSPPVLKEEQLDPNRANASRLEVLRTFLGIEGQFDQGIGVQNRIALQNFRDAQEKRNAARVALEERQAERAQADAEVVQLDEQIARLSVEDQLADTARGTAPPSAADSERKQTLAVIKAREAARKADRDRLDGEIKDLKTAADAVPAAPTLASSPVSSSAATLPTSDALKKFTDKALDEALTPSLAASTALDNYVDMQYEILSKQLTLLRDEVGPDERVIFLELPASIYTVDKWAGGYIGQVEWQVAGYYDQEPPDEVKREVIQQNFLNEGKSALEICEAWEDNNLLPGKAPRKERLKECVSRLPGEGLTENTTKYLESLREDKETTTILSSKDKQKYPLTLDMLEKATQPRATGTPFQKKALTRQETQCTAEDFAQKPMKPKGPTNQEGVVRAIEIIPRQSALNVNEDHATTNNFSILGVLKLISGFGAKLDFQRQREVYEKFLQQKAFASGFGQGSYSFGWTFGPLPGSKRLEPGQRTTYAVLAVPRNTWALELEARTRAFPRDVSPCRYANSQWKKYTMLVPGEATERFWVEGIAYAPVPKGKRVTAVLDGSYFSPQLGVLVNGTPLKKVLSITRAGSDEPLATGTGQGVEGEYEITNSREIILSFSMGSDFIGTPTITLGSPEKSNAINAFWLDINHHGRDKLKEHSLTEPMFIEAFSPATKLELLNKKTDPFVFARLSGAGLRREAEVSINDKPVGEAREEKEKRDEVAALDTRQCKDRPFVEQESTHSYRLCFENPKKDTWKVRYQQKTLQGFEEAEFKQVINPPFSGTLRHFSPGHPAEADLIFHIPDEITGSDQLKITLDDPRAKYIPGRQGCAPPDLDESEGSFRVKCLVPAASGGKRERDTISVRVFTSITKDQKKVETTRFVDIPLPVRPQILTIKNLLTGKATGFANDDATVIIRGVNLQHVTGVLFGDKEAQITIPADSQGLTVKVPKAHVPKGQKSAVPVVLRTDAGLLISAGTYVYEGEPLPKSDG